MKTAVVHEWLTTCAGSEKALEQILALYPEADLYALVDFLPDEQRSVIRGKKATTSFIQSLPFARKKYRSYLPLMPFAVERFDLSVYDLVISSSHAVAKGAPTRADQMHICYCYTPMRYAWDLQQQYLKESGLDRGLKGLAARMILRYMRSWDRRTSDRVGQYIAISYYIAERIKRVYGREAAVIYPPVDVDFFVPGAEKEDFYLTASRMVPYKKVKLIVEAFSQMPEKRLVVIGDGPDFAGIRMKAGKNIDLLGYQPSQVLRSYMQKAKAFIYAADEDFGMVAVEAQACGTPVIAYGRGGSVETVKPLPDPGPGTGNEEQAHPTGVFYYEQTTEALREAVKAFEKNRHQFDSNAIRKNAERFGIERFRREFKNYVDSVIASR